MSGNYGHSANGRGIRLYALATRSQRVAAVKPPLMAPPRISVSTGARLKP
jgi:hypothetical protein